MSVRYGQINLSLGPQVAPLANTEACQSLSDDSDPYDSFASHVQVVAVNMGVTSKIYRYMSVPIHFISFIFLTVNF